MQGRRMTPSLALASIVALGMFGVRLAIWRIERTSSATKHRLVRLLGRCDGA